MKCVQRYCPAGLVTVPRELEEDGAAPGGISVDDVIKLCAALKCDAVTSTLQETLCLSAHCDEVVSTVEGAGTSRMMLHDDATASQSPHLENGSRVSGKDSSSSQRLRLMRYSLLNLCGEVHCPSSRGADFLDCMALRCYPTATRDETEDLTEIPEPAASSDQQQQPRDSSDANRVDQSAPGLMRKRRVNAINAQCIQSQCGSKSGPARRLCMINFCHGR